MDAQIRKKFVENPIYKPGDSVDIKKSIAQSTVTQKQTVKEL